jgi:hypothetical protein
MAQREPTAAQALYGHLRSGERAERTQRAGTVGDALWPSLSRAAKAAEADQRLWADIVRRQRDNFVRGWREAKGRR